MQSAAPGKVGVAATAVEHRSILADPAATFQENPTFSVFPFDSRQGDGNVAT